MQQKQRCDDTDDIGPYDFHKAENIDGITESSYKRVYSILQNVMDFGQFWINKPQVGLYSESNFDAD